MFNIGTETQFKEALKNLLVLDYDAIEAYKAAINRLRNEEYKITLIRFKEDHETHIRELSELLRKHNEEVPDKPSMNQWLTKGKVIIANIMHDSGIIAAMLSNEEETNDAYSKINSREDIWDDAEETLQRGYEDEVKHLLWLKTVNK